jgi:thioesterase domain-containing protein
VRLHVLDASLNSVPRGVTGELYIAGDGLAHGYVNQPALTAARFVADPHGPSGERIYRTGDLTRRRRDGAIEFVGRADTQVKIRGHRVELEDIEAALSRCADVAAAAAVVMPDPAGDSRLLAYVSPTAGRTIDVVAVRRELRAHVPAHMMPAVITVLPSLPVTAHGKIDRRALPAPVPERKGAEALPRTAHEQALCELFADVLGVESVGLDDDFFERGGHSLSAMRLIAVANARLHVEASVRSVFDAPTVRGLARAISGDARRVDATRTLVTIRGDGTLPPVFCVPPAAAFGRVYVPLARAFDTNRAVYALQAGDDLDRHAPSLRAIVDESVRAIRDLNADAPCVLLGWSIGGLVAHAVACRLQREGVPVVALAALDVHPPFGAHDDERTADRIETQLAAIVQRRRPAGAIASTEVERIRRELERARHLRRQVTPDAFDGDLLLFRATDSEPYQSAWSSYVSGRVLTFDCECDHLDMMDPGPVDRIAGRLEVYLRAQPSAAHDYEAARHA